MKIHHQKQQPIQSGLYSFIIEDYSETIQALTVSKLSSKLNDNKKEKKVKKEKKEKTCYTIEQFEDEKESQLFYLFYDEDDGCYSIISYKNNTCIGVDSQRVEIGRPIMELSLGFTSNKKWKIVEKGNTQKNTKLYEIQS